MPRKVIKFQMRDGSVETFEFFAGPRAAEVSLRHWWIYDADGNSRLGEVDKVVAFDAPDPVEQP